MFTLFVRPAAFRQSLKAVPFLLGASVLLRPRPIVFNDAVTLSQPGTLNAPRLDTKPAPLSKKLDYNELCLGSVTGLFLGIVIGKLSSAIVFLTVSAYLLLQFLENKGVITIPWRRIVTIGDRLWDLKSLFFDKPSFKISFVSSFLIAAFNV